MTASVLKQDPNTKRFKRMLIYYDTETDTQYAIFWGNLLHQATKGHLTGEFDKGDFPKKVHVVCPCHNK